MSRLPKKIRLAILWFPALLPAYVWRLYVGPLPTTFLEICFWILAIGVTLSTGSTVWREGWERSKPWRIPVALWILATVIAIFVAPNHVAALGLWRAYVLEPLIFFVLLLGSLNDEHDREEVVRALVVSLSIVTAWAVIQFVTGRFIPHPWDTDIWTRRATGPFPFPNALSLFAAPIGALCVVRLSSRNDVLWIGLVSAILSTLLAKSVGGFIAITVCVLIVLLSRRTTRRPTIIAAFLIAFTVLAIPVTRTKVVSTLSFHEWSGQVRTIIWKETVAMLKDHIVFGAGFGAYPDAIKPYHKATYIEIFQYPHNILLNLWSETGLLGILAFGWICVMWIKVVKSQKSKALALPLLAILIHGLVDVPYFKNDLAFQFWILAALATF